MKEQLKQAFAEKNTKLCRACTNCDQKLERCEVFQKLVKADHFGKDCQRFEVIK